MCSPSYVGSGFSRTAIIVTLSAATIAGQAGPYERQKVDEAAATRGRAVYAQQCINCHGSTGKGTDRGPDLIRSAVVLRDRLGNGIGPAITSSRSHQAKLTGAQIVDLSHFLHQRIESIASNRNPRAPIDVLTGDPEAGRAYFNGAGTCITCHSATGDMAGISTRINDPMTLQQRWLFPTLRRSGPRQVEVVAGGKTVSGALVRLDDFSVSLRDAAGQEQSFDRGPGVTVTVRDPLAAHHALLDRYTDADMHNVTTYLWTLK
ncbi:MAG TPA: c-type cytochrome [Vicinamibacterales bacterium]|jgi:mono/diheme cytochrome c family protein